MGLIHSKNEKTKNKKKNNEKNFDRLLSVYSGEVLKIIIINEEDCESCLNPHKLGRDHKLNKRKSTG